ncbi:MAG: glutamine--fructose-6-phosphate transaminase (isomerizing), partial [Chlamydiae bacterium RIFCSPHIGHO2_12_FULL_49_11]
MCGIYGHIKMRGTDNSVLVCLDGLKKLEYRGYDSAGIAGISDGKIVSYKSVGHVSNLDQKLKTSPLELEMAIAHTRWATHGGLSETNAHPHIDMSQSVALVHNGIVENYAHLKSKLERKGVVFQSETDTEVIAELVSHYYEFNLLRTMQKVLPELEGSFAIAFIHKDHPGKIIASARRCPLVIGICHETQDVFLSSDTNAFSGKTLDVFYLSDDETAIISPQAVEVFNSHGIKITKPMETLRLIRTNISKEGYEHFMLKEIFEQPITIANALEDRILEDYGMGFFPELSHIKPLLQSTNHILILACGSSYHAGCITAAQMEAFARIPTQVEIASEFRYTNPIVSENTLVIAISQSGETADTLAAVREAKSKGATIIGVCNMSHSTLTREADACLFTRAGPEVSVCSTKAFSSQLALLFLFTITMARMRHMTKEEGKEFIADLKKLPAVVTQVLSQKSIIEKYALRYAGFDHFFFIGRRYMYPTSLEAALKLKEISYINAVGYAAGEMK